MEIKIQLNDFDYIVIDDYHNGGIYFRMFSKSQLGKINVWNDGNTQKMGISEQNIDSFISSLQDIRKLMKLKNKEQNYDCERIGTIERNVSEKELKKIKTLRTKYE